MNILLNCGLVSFLVSVGLMPIVSVISRKFGAMSEVGGRHVGKFPVGRFGGIGVLFGCLFALLIQFVFYFEFRNAVYNTQTETLGIMLGLAIVGGVGFWDDVCRLPAATKLGFQVLSAATAYRFGIQIDAVDLPFLKTFSLGLLSFPVTLIWIVGIINAINLIDGLDGLAGGVLVFAASINLVVAIISQSILISNLMCAVVGSLIGFLIFNWYPARIYLGDGGAYSLGFLIAISGLISPMQKAPTGLAILVPVLAAGLPIIDTILVMFRRIASRRKIFSPDRGHLHHILLDSGISHRRVVIGLYMICCIFCSIALTMVLHRNREVGWYLVGAAVFGVVVWGIGVRNQLLGIIKSRSFK